MVKTTYFCDICGKETDIVRRPKITFECDSLFNGLNHFSGPSKLFGDKDVCPDCQKALYDDVNVAVIKIIEELQKKRQK